MEAVGSYWVKSGQSSWSLGSDAAIESSTYLTVGNSSTDKDEWGGYYFKWMRNTGNESPMGSALYKISNSDGSAYFFLDERDAVTNYSPNIYIEYDADPYVKKYTYYKNGAFTGNNITDGSILHIWDIKGASPQVSNLSNYWSNSLTATTQNTNPRLIWGIYPDDNISVDNYCIYRNVSSSPLIHPSVDASLIATVSSSTYSYVDGDISVNGGDYVYYFVKAKYGSSYTSGTNILDINGVLYKRNSNNVNQKKFKNSLAQNYPNPFNPSTTIKYSIPKNSLVTLKVYDVLGRKVKTLVNEYKAAGDYDADFDASHLASGIYFYRITAGKYTAVRKMQLLK